VRPVANGGEASKSQNSKPVVLAPAIVVSGLGLGLLVLSAARASRRRAR
jgi:hypothetical protein